MSHKSTQRLLEERKLVEESDNELTESLFSDAPSRKQDDDIKPAINKNMSTPLAPFKKRKIVENKAIIEQEQEQEQKQKQKQKDLAIKNKNRKHVLHKKREIFGEYDYDYNDNNDNNDNNDKYYEIEAKYLD